MRWSWLALCRALLSHTSSCASFKTCLRFRKRKKVLSQHLSCSVYLFQGTLCIQQMQGVCLHVYLPVPEDGTYLKVMGRFWLVWFFLGHPPEPPGMMLTFTSPWWSLWSPQDWDICAFQGTHWDAKRCIRRCRFPWLLRFLIHGKICLELVFLSSLWSHLSLEGFWW